MLNFKKHRWLWLSFLFYLLSFILYAIFTYSLTAPNLVLSQNRQFWQFQTYMWKTFFNNRELLTQTYFGLMLLIFSSYLFFVSRLLKVKAISLKLMLLLLGVLIVPLLASSNALSYDVFNYIFNAKMMVVYQVDPHVQVALNFPDDPWTKFMHNTHTTAPYGHGWTYLSLIPFSLGMGKFISTWLSFRLFNLIPLFALAIIYWRNYRQAKPTWAALVIFNPLLLIEVVSNSHNDLWMMMPAITGLLFLAKNQHHKMFYLKAALALAIIGLTMWIKLATLALLPIWFLIVIKPLLKNIPRFESLLSNWPYLASIAMFLPLLTTRSQQFHPWYLLWPLTFVPLIRTNRWIMIWMQSLLILSISSMFRYLPFLWNNNYEGNVLLWQKAITFIPFVLALLYFTRQNFVRKSKTHKLKSR